MPQFNWNTSEITVKIVYYGPGVGGKTTNLIQLHARLDPEFRRDMDSQDTGDDRTLLFDLLPVDDPQMQINGLKLRVQLYTVPGQVRHNESRKAVLRNADGIVFVADSSTKRYAANLESMQNLYDNLRDLGLDPVSRPMVLQYNKRDLPDAVQVAQMQEDLNPEGLPAYEAVAVDGIGVAETFGAILSAVKADLGD